MDSPRTDRDRAAVEVTMPETGTVDGALLVSWLKPPGAPVEADEPICLVRVDDLEAEIVSPAPGVMGGIYAEAGQRLRAGDSLAEIRPTRSDPRAIEEPQASPEPGLESESDTNPPAGRGVEEGLETRTHGREARGTPFAPTGPAAEPVEPEPKRAPLPVQIPDPLAGLASEIEVLEIAVPDLDLRLRPEPPPPSPSPKIDLATFRSPAVRRLAAAHGVDLASVPGTGREGRITRDDVLVAVANQHEGG